MIFVMEFILVLVRISCLSHDSHVLYHERLSVVSYFWDSIVIIFPTCLRKGFISSSPRTRGGIFELLLCDVRRGVPMIDLSCDIGLGDLVWSVVIL